MTAAETARNRAAFDRFHDATNSGSYDVIEKMIDEVVAPDAVFHAPVPMEASGPQALKQVWTVLLRAFPDLRVTAEDVLADGDKIVCRNTVTGTHGGEYRGMPATGKPVSYGEIFILRFAGGRVAEIWGVVDVLTQLRQLGALAA
ncbi:ester cyclase [Amycolatopsis roodepoortensis]|uniref:Ester cyclase n=1 Tax=Amycolatopsis roodepoortensis TaxID=700274 RepID=A0ABR9KZ39_9PSEU|nr:ester cyclase [Amycolatopsis roodepoortensis]MBE1573636.1 putative ester cyclase [Amycolatopsis roodepoortensis]